MAAGRKKATTRKNATSREPDPPDMDEEDEDSGDDDAGEEESDEEESGEEESGEEESGEEESGEEEEKPTLTKAEKKALFEAYQEASELLEEAEAAVETVKEQLSDAAGAIGTQIHMGPFLWKGREVRITKRGERFYMRKSSSEAEKI